VPSPSGADAGTQARFTLAAGNRDENGGSLDKLHDGRTPANEDQPAENFFFEAGTAGGRIVADLGCATEFKAVNTYSWHPGSRGPQVYTLYASDGLATNFNARPRAADPEKHGWERLAAVDTRPKPGAVGGQYGVSVTNPGGQLGRFRYVLFDVARTEASDAFGNTFYSELDIVSADPAFVAAPPPAPPPPEPFRVRSADGYCEIIVDTADAPELKDWAEQKLAPVLADWYPRIVALLPSEGYVAPTSFSVILRPGRGVAATGGTRITANSDWIQRELRGEAVGALVHEMIHVVQQYGRIPRGAPRPPGWLVEGITDCIRWFQFEPESHGADLVWLRQQRNLALRHDASYRITANFLNWVAAKHDPKIIQHLNAAIREGKYGEDVWKQFTGKSAEELNAAWKADVEKELAGGPAAEALRQK
jgi:hypothetical protein